MIRAQRSLRWIQLIHCRPLPIGPPNPVRTPEAFSQVRRRRRPERCRCVRSPAEPPTAPPQPPLPSAHKGLRENRRPECSIRENACPSGSVKPIAEALTSTFGGLDRPRFSPNEVVSSRLVSSSPVGRSPTLLGNRFPRQVDHRIGLIQGIEQPGVGPVLPAGSNCIQVSRPSARSAS